MLAPDVKRTIKTKQKKTTKKNNKKQNKRTKNKKKTNKQTKIKQTNKQTKNKWKQTNKNKNKIKKKNKQKIKKNNIWADERSLSIWILPNVQHFFMFHFFSIKVTCLSSKDLHFRRKCLNSDLYKGTPVSFNFWIHCMVYHLQNYLTSLIKRVFVEIR